MTTLIAVQETTTSKQQIRAGSGELLFGDGVFPVPQQVIQNQFIYPIAYTRLLKLHKYKRIFGWAVVGSLTFLGGEHLLSLPYEPGLAIFFSVASTYLVFWMKVRDAR